MLEYRDIFRRVSPSYSLIRLRCYCWLVQVKTDVTTGFDRAISARPAVGHLGYVSLFRIADAVGRAFFRASLLKAWHAPESIITYDVANPPIFGRHGHSGVA